MVIKLNKANVMLYKIRQFVNERTLISIYHAICDSHLNYVSIVWRQTKSSINRIFLIQKKAIRTIHFKSKFHHTSSLFSESDIIKLQLPEIFNFIVSVAIIIYLFLLIIIIIIIVIIVIVN